MMVIGIWELVIGDCRKYLPFLRQWDMVVVYSNQQFCKRIVASFSEPNCYLGLLNSEPQQLCSAETNYGNKDNTKLRRLRRLRTERVFLMMTIDLRRCAP